MESGDLGGDLAASESATSTSGGDDGALLGLPRFLWIFLLIAGCRVVDVPAFIWPFLVLAVILIHALYTKKRGKQGRAEETDAELDAMIKRMEASAGRRRGGGGGTTRLGLRVGVGERVCGGRETGCGGARRHGETTRMEG